MKSGLFSAAAVLPAPLGAAGAATDFGPIVLDQAAQSLVTSATWDDAGKRLVVEAPADDFVHIRVNRGRLFDTGQVPLPVFGNASQLHVEIFSLDANGQVLETWSSLNTYGQTPGYFGGVGTTVAAGTAASVRVVIEFGWPQGYTPPDTSGCCGTGDADCDLIIDDADIGLFIGMMENEERAADVDGDGCHDGADLDNFIDSQPLSICH